MNLIANIMDFGADPTGARDSLPALNAARDRLATLPPNLPKQLYIPEGLFNLRGTFVPGLPNLAIRGAGSDMTRLLVTDYGPGIYVDAPDAGLDFSRVRPDCYGILDNSIAPAPGWAYGFSNTATGDPGPRYWIVVAGGPPAVIPGGGWQSISTLTLDVCLADIPKVGSVVGIGEGGWEPGGAPNPCPFYLVRRLNGGNGLDEFLFHFRTTQGQWLTWGNAPRQFMFGDLSRVDTSRPIRVTVTVDMTRDGGGGLCQIRAWVNGKEQPVRRDYGTRSVSGTPSGTPSGATNEPSFGVADRLTFAANKMASFKLGNPRWTDNTTQIGDPTRRPRLACYGFGLGKDNPYTSDGSGNQVRADGGPLVDSYRYLFGAGRDASRLVSCFNTNPNSSPVKSRFVRFSSGYANVGIIRWDNDPGLPTVPGGQSIRDLSISCWSFVPAGVLLGVCFGWGFEMENVNIGGGQYGLLMLNDGAKYDVSIRGNCAITGQEAWIQGMSCILTVESLRRGYVYNSGLRLAGGDVRVGRIVTGDTMPGSRVLDILDLSDYAGSYVFDYVGVDNEGVPNTPVFIAKHPTVPTSVVINNFNPGAHNASNPAVRLVNHWPGSPTTRPRLILNNVVWSDPSFYFSAEPALGDPNKNEWTVIVDGKIAR